MQQQNIIQNIYQSTKTIKGKLQLHHRPPLHTRPYQGELQQDFQRSTTRTDIYNLIYNLVLCTKTCISTQHVNNLNNKLMRTFSYVNNLNNKLDENTQLHLNCQHVNTVAAVNMTEMCITSNTVNITCVNCKQNDQPLITAER